MVEGDWYLEDEPNGYLQGLRIKQRLASKTTGIQALQVIDTDCFGRALILDEALQITEYDEFMYHEMLVHVPLMTHPEPRHVLIVGGGDGGTLRRVLEYRKAEPVQVEIDTTVIDACREYLPSIAAGAFDDPRARVVIDDGIDFVRQCAERFDIVIVDSTDPIGSAVGLFQEGFYRDVANCLEDDGMLAAQSSSPLFMATELREQVDHLRAVFPLVRTYLGLVPGYPGTLWSYTIGSKRYDPLEVAPGTIARRLAEDGIHPRYYGPQLHAAAFVLPRFIADILGP